MKSFSQVSSADLENDFGIQIFPKPFIPSVSKISLPDWLIQVLDFQKNNLAMIRNEKAISETIISPILMAVQNLYAERITVFSGEPMSTSELSGVCDFLITKGRIFDPKGGYLILVEAKKQDLLSGIPQCVAEMYAAQTLNKNDDLVYGCVSTGFEWLFIKLENKTAIMHPNVFTISEVDKILGVFGWIVEAA